MREILAPALAGFCLVAGAAAAQTAADSETMAASKLFPLLDTYLGLPLTERDQFHLEYAVTGNAAGANTHLMLKRPSGDVPIALAADGRILTLPDLADIKSAQVVMTTPKGSHYGISLHIVANEAPAQRLDVAPLKAGIDQARAAGRKTAGLMAMMAPDFETVCFVDAGSGQAILDDGKTIALKISAPPSMPKFLNPCLTPADQPRARQVSLAHTPTAILIVRRPTN